jgi:hypothetical protein
MHIKKFSVVAKNAGISYRQFLRLNELGLGPTITYVGPRSPGVLDTDEVAWLLSLRRPSPTTASVEKAIAHLRDDIIDSVQNALLDGRDANQETMAGLAQFVDLSIANFAQRVLTPPAKTPPQKSTSSNIRA